jgi:DNA-binding NarL/FixJ family response regulator
VERSAVVFDVHPLWLEAVEGVLVRHEIKVRGKTTNGGEALDLVRTHQPDVLVLEPEDGVTASGGLDLMRRATDARPGLKIVVLGDSRETGTIDAAFAAGAVAYVFKSAHPDDLASAIRQAFDMSIFLSPPQRGLSAPSALRAAEPANDNTPGLTKREVEILQLVSEGHSNGELARMLWVTEQTVKFHLSNIYRKLSVANRTEASRWAQVHGLLGAPLASAALASSTAA